MTTKLTFKQQLNSFPNAFWVANIMELIERLAYFGVRAVVGLYIVDAAVRGGLELTHPQRGLIFTIWALFQTLLPMFTGAYSDRYGYKKSLYIAFSMNTVAYILMGLANSYLSFFGAALLLATGTAIFKPPLHGTLAHTVKDENSSVGWGMFYMLVNIGGFLGPFIAGICRVIAWKYVFFASAAIIFLNFIPTIFFLKDYSVEVRKSKGDVPETGPVGTFITGIMTLVKDTRFMVFLLIFSGFWLMFMQLFDTLPIYIDEWADTSKEAAWFVENVTLNGINVVGWILVALTTLLTLYAIITKKKVLAIMSGLAVLIAYTLKLGITQVVESAVIEKVIKPEFMVNIDAGAIVFFMLVIAVFTGKMKPIIAMIVGMLISTVGIIACGSFMTGWLVALAIFVFAVGEMACSPKFSEYIGLMAPPEKKAIYMGYSNIPFAIGWTLAGQLSGWLYAIFSDKFKFARDYMVDHLNMDAAMVGNLEKLEVMPTLAQALNCTQLEATKVLWDAYHPWIMWWIFAGIGLVATVAMVFYHFWLEADKKKREGGWGDAR